MNILASDDGHGVISFNTSEHFLLREPTSLSGLSDSVATLFVVRHPEDGTFGTVTVQFTVTDANGSLAEGDVIPLQGFVVLEDGVRFKVRKNIYIVMCFQYSYDIHMLSFGKKTNDSFQLFQMLEIRAVLDAEPEVNETFTVTLSNPTGGARLGDQLQVFVTVLENLAPSGLFRIRPTINRSQYQNRSPYLFTTILKIKNACVC